MGFFLPQTNQEKLIDKNLNSLCKSDFKLIVSGPVCLVDSDLMTAVDFNEPRQTSMSDFESKLNQLNPASPHPPLALIVEPFTLSLILDPVYLKKHPYI